MISKSSISSINKFPSIIPFPILIWHSPILSFASIIFPNGVFTNNAWSNSFLDFVNLEVRPIDINEWVALGPNNALVAYMFN